MKRLGFMGRLVLCLVLLQQLAIPVLANEHDAPYRFAVVNMSDVLKRAPQSAAESEQLEERFADRERALAAKQDELRKANDALDYDRSRLSGTELLNRESQLRVMQRRLKREREDLREEVRLSKDKALNRLQTEVADAIEAIRRRESLDIIFRESDYIVASERVDVTGKVLEELQRLFEVSQNKQQAATEDKPNGE